MDAVILNSAPSKVDNKNYKRNQLQMLYKIDAFTTALQALTSESFLKKEEVRIEEGEHSGKY